MTRRILLTAVTLLAMLAAQAQLRIGVVNVQEIYAAMPQMEAARQQFEATSQQYQSELEGMRAEFQKKYTEYQALNNDRTTSEAIKERRLQELQTIDRNIQEFLGSASSQLNDYEQQLLQPVINRVTEAINRVGEREGFTIIYGDLSPVSLSTSNAGLQPVYMGAGVTDLTAKVRQELGL